MTDQIMTDVSSDGVIDTFEPEMDHGYDYDLIGTRLIF